MVKKYDGYNMTTNDSDFIYDQAVIINVYISGPQDFATKEERHEIKQLETKISALLPEASGIDGDEFGDGEAVIYVYGPDANQIFEAIEPALKAAPFDHVDITLQYGLPDDPATKDKKFTL